MASLRQARVQRYAWLLLILLLAVFLRLHDLDAIPPGMTHDEADHGMDAWGVVQGIRPLYFTVGYGREPLYDYSTALLMSFLGPSYLAGRLTAVFFSLLMLAASYAWTRRAFSEPVALLTAAGLAFGFWPLMVARHALRTVTMPALFTLAFLLFWRGLERRDAGRTAWLHALSAGVLLGLTFYTYFPARIMWLLFPALLIYRLLQRQRSGWRQLLLIAVMALAVAAPLFVYLTGHPQAEARLDQLSGPLTSLRNGDWRPLWENSLGALRIVAIEGDVLWRYNIPGRPLLPPVLAVLFVLGLALAAVRAVVCLRQERVFCREAAASFIAVAWFVGGLAPALITGPDASTTRVAAMQPVFYLFPALALVALVRLLRRGRSKRWALLLPAFSLLIYGSLLAGTAEAYFQTWGRQTEVRIQYEANLVRAVRRLNESAGGPAAISTDAPDRFHDPSTARMYLTNEAVDMRWFNGRRSLLLPQDEPGMLVVTSSAPLHPLLQEYLAETPIVETLPAAGAETDSPLIFYAVDGSALLHTVYPQFQQLTPRLSTELSTDRENVVFGDAVTFLGYRLYQQQPLQAGEKLQVATLWKIRQPLPESWILFTHLLGEEGEPVAQADSLDVPSFYWHPGDVFIQLHEIDLPPDLPPGSYDLALGFYTLPEWWQRLPFSLNGEPAGDLLLLPPVEVTS